MGNFVLNPSYYLVSKQLQKTITYDFFYFGYTDTPNKYWEKILNRNLYINNFFKYFEIFNRWFGKNNNHSIRMLPELKNESNCIFYKNTNVINFTENEEKTGYNFLKSLNISLDKKIVCLLIRDSGYKNKFFPEDLGGDWSRHDYRNANIKNYELAIKYLTNKGYAVFRMGKFVNQKLDFKHPNYFDYANSSYSSDFLYIWLMKSCSFCISTSTGLDMLASVFSKPMLLTDHLPYADYPCNIMARLGSPIFLDLFKKIINKKTNNFLSIKELIKQNIIFSYKNYDYIKNDLQIIDNDENEILSATKEIESYFLNQSLITLEKSALQKKYWVYMKKFKLIDENMDTNNIVISENFLKNNASWLFRD